MSRVFQALERTEELRRRKTSAIPEAPQQDNRSGPPSPSDTGEFERLASTILQARTAAPFTTMMITSPHHGEGTSTVAVGVARILAGRLRVLLVDANFRSPGLTVTDLLLAAQPGAGLVEALAGQADVETIITESGVPGLRLVTAGAVDSESPRLLQTSRLAPLMSQLAETTDMVILDAPPVMPYADALTLASRVERVVLVTQAEHTQRGHLERAKEELDQSGTAMLGVVLNRTASHAPSWLQRRLNL
jgi:receptor protein-tyrosine kinase